MSILELRNVSYEYGKGTPFAQAALKNVSVSFEKGLTTGIIGHTGSGKSTLVQMLNALLKPDQGQVLLDGKDINADKKKLRQVRFDVGLVFQYPEYQLFEETIEKDVAYGPKNMGLDPAEIKERVIKSLAFTGLDENYLDQSPFEISGGQKRRVAIAGVMAMMPKVLVLDEPAAGLDPIGRDTIFNGIKNWREQTGGTVIIVSHSMEDMARFCDRILVLSHGEVYKYGTPSDIFSDAENIVKLGLDIPQITEICLGLRAKGYDIPDNIYTVSDAHKAILKVLEGGSNA